MSRTINGKCTGQAARIEARDWREIMTARQDAARTARLYKIQEMCQRVRNMMTQEEYDAWWDSCSVHRFGEQAEKKLAELLQAADYQADTQERADLYELGMGR